MAGTRRLRTSAQNLRAPPGNAISSNHAIEIDTVRPIFGLGPSKGKNVDINARIEEQLNGNNVLLYMKGTPDFPQCGFSGQTVAALNAIGKPYAYVNIFEDQEIREGL